MHHRTRTLLWVALSLAFAVNADAATGTIRGRITITGPAPANPVIRMGADPVCAALARSTRALPTQQFVIADGNGGLANVVVTLQGSFPATTPPDQPVVINQRTCVYQPRVVAARVGQTLRIVNQDTTLHNIHSQSTKNPFNVTQPKSGMVFNYVLKATDLMLRLTCDVHSWMRGYVAVVPHPYFAVTASDGSFTIDNVPAGRYPIRIWHERFGEQTRTIVVTAGKVTALDLAYNPRAEPRVSRMRDLSIPATE